MSTETTATYTPGPWKVAEHQGVYVWDANGAVAYANARGSDPRGTSEANARLIAASPDLLAACKALLGFQCLRDYEDTPVIQEARAAIAKAERT